MRIAFAAFVLCSVAVLGQATNLGYSSTYPGTHGCQGAGTCYYVDVVGGSDSNNGTSKGTAWAHAPGMACATGIAASHTQISTDAIIFKGGDTWPAACFPWTSSAALYIGYDPTWNAGTVNSVRVVDPGYCTTGTTLSISFSGGGGASAAASASMERVDTVSNPTLLSFVTVSNHGSGYTSNPSVSFTVTAGSCSKLPSAYADIYAPLMSGNGSTFGTASSVPTMFTVGGSSTTVDGIEFAHYHIYSNSDYTYAGIPAMLQSTVQSVTWENLFVHDFAMANVSGFNTFCILGGNCHNIDIAQNGGLYLGNTTAQSTVTNSVFNNYEAEAQGCAAGNGYSPPYPSTGCVEMTGIYTQWYSGSASGSVVTNNIISNWRGGMYTAGTATNNLVAGNKMWGILHDVGTQHEDAFYLQSGGLTYNNVLRDVYSGSAAFYVENGDSVTPTANGLKNYLFNNVVFDIGNSTPPIGWTSEFVGSGATGISPSPDMRSWNNTFYSNQGTADCVNSGQWFGGSPDLSLSPGFNFTLYNNHCITTQGSVHWFDSNGSAGACAANGCGIWNTHTNPNTTATQNLVDPLNTIQSPTTATSQGYTPANNFAPTSSSNDTVTFASGGNSQNLTSLCSTTLGGLSLANLCYDILGNARPAVGGWNSGAYQFSSASQPAQVQGQGFTVSGGTIN